MDNLKRAELYGDVDYLIYVLKKLDRSSNKSQQWVKKRVDLLIKILRYYIVTGNLRSVKYYAKKMIVLTKEYRDLIELADYYGIRGIAFGSIANLVPVLFVPTKILYGINGISCTNKSMEINSKSKYALLAVIDHNFKTPEFMGGNRERAIKLKKKYEQLFGQEAWLDYLLLTCASDDENQLVNNKGIDHFYFQSIIRNSKSENNNHVTQSD